MQVLFAAMLVNAFHAALEDRIVAFNRVGVMRSSRAGSIGRVFFGHFVPVADDVLAVADRRGSQTRRYICRTACSSVISLASRLILAAMIGGESLTRVPSTWKLRADPPRSTSVKTAFLWEATAAAWADPQDGQ